MSRWGVLALLLAGCWLVLVALVLAGCVSATLTTTPTPTTTGAIQGFAADVTGGAGKPVVMVSNINASGAGSFREAVCPGGNCGAGNRYVKFSSGACASNNSGNPIHLASALVITGPNITISAYGADDPGCGIVIGNAPGTQPTASTPCGYMEADTIKNQCSGHGITIRGANATNIIIQGLHIRDLVVNGDPPSLGSNDEDGIGILDSASRIVVQYTTILHNADSALDVTGGSDPAGKKGAHHVTIADSLILQPNPTDGKNMMFNGDPGNGWGGAHSVSMYRNGLIGSTACTAGGCGHQGAGGTLRSPSIYGNSTSDSGNTIADVRNNLIYGFLQGTLLRNNSGNPNDGGPRANVVKNYYKRGFGSASKIRCETIRPYTLKNKMHVSGNVTGDDLAGANINTPPTPSECSDVPAGVVYSSSPVPAPAITEMSACDAAHTILQSAGAPHRDARENAIINAVQLTGCGPPPTQPVTTPPAETPPRIAALSSTTDASRLSFTLSRAPLSTEIIVLGFFARKQPEDAALPMPIITLSGVTWTNRAAQQDSSVARKLYVFTGVCSGTCGTALTIDFGAAVISSLSGDVLAIPGFDPKAVPAQVTYGVSPSATTATASLANPFAASTNRAVWFIGRNTNTVGDGQQCDASHRIVSDVLTSSPSNRYMSFVREATDDLSVSCSWPNATAAVHPWAVVEFGTAAPPPVTTPAGFQCDQCQTWSCPTCTPTSVWQCQKCTPPARKP